MQDIKEFQVFIASPSDVEEEKKIVRKVCENLNKDPLVRGKRIQLEHKGWEDLAPSAGRPQDTINSLQEKCDIFVCILHRKYGTGTMEEFWNAYESWKNFKKPGILFYFKKAEISSLSDLEDPQLKKVFELKDKIQKDELLLYGNFTTPEDFETILSDHFKKLISDLLSKPAEEPEKLVKKSGARIPEKYRAWLNDTTSCMDIDCIRQDSRVINVSLPEIFQPLFSQDPDKEPEKRKKKDPSARLDIAEAPVPIEALAGKGKTLLVIGTAGSGKTTLARHMARTIVNNTSPYFEKDLLPVLIFFKDLKFYPYQGKTPCAEAANDILGRYCSKYLSGFLDLETILLFCEKGKCVFFLDGLDEAEQELRDFAAVSFADFRVSCDPVKLVLLGRPHGAEGKVGERFGTRVGRVLDLTHEQVEAFIGNWFSHVYSEGSVSGETLAGSMKGDIRAREDIDELKKNPLLLTAMCILYHDLKELPNQRADLYNRYVERLFSKFGDERIKVTNFMMNLAHSMFEAGERGIDEADAVKTLKNHYKIEDMDKTHEDLFKRIEPATGLLKFESGRYKFIHLTFQEFLTARYLVDHTEDSPFDIISPHIEHKRYEEVVKLFIGFLSIRNSGGANKITRQILEENPGEPKVDNYILAAEALLDIHKDNRQEKVVDLAKDRMQALIRKGEAPNILLRAGEAMGRLGFAAGLEEFVAIPGGTYDLDGLGKKKIQAFEISRFPVTNLWYAQFIKDGGYETEAFWSGEGRKWLGQNKVSEPGSWRERRFNCPTSPVVGVSWFEAEAFCRWLETKNGDGFSCHLPTEEEWQATAAGKEKREYPWGDGIDPQKCNYDETKLGKPSPVGIFSGGKTPEGVHDLGGNVWEWTRSGYHQKKTYEDFPYDPEMDELLRKKDFAQYSNKLLEKDRIVPALRGGSFSIGSGNCRCTFRSDSVPDERDLNIGFRCARIKL
ncbi:MAG: hypothetical protein A2277_16030 [Desulfobacterales bacterium RIFOXYA12_FULL_46_15]|nr:MAG: hypothetical protein A2277_16030 [Desulfobacterales bacterium RIFOXYA12_FULL_46_15]